MEIKSPPALTSATTPTTQTISATYTTTPATETCMKSPTQGRISSSASGAAKTERMVKMVLPLLMMISPQNNLRVSKAIKAIKERRVIKVTMERTDSLQNLNGMI